MMQHMFRINIMNFQKNKDKFKNKNKEKLKDRKIYNDKSQSKDRNSYHPDHPEENKLINNFQNNIHTYLKSV